MFVVVEIGWVSKTISPSLCAAGMPKHQQKVRKTPYTRPAPQPEKQGFFSRLKSFFWGSQEPVELGSPRIIDESTAGGDLSYQTEDDQSRITHSSLSYDRPNESSIRSDSPGLLSTASAGPEPVGDGPNEALRRFFEEKDGQDLSNMEVVGVLSLISQAVSRNESLVDFSNLSEITASTIGNNTTTTAANADQTTNDNSMLWGLHAPPTPRPYMRGTPPTSQTRARATYAAPTERSPWTSPRPSRISARHSITTGFGRPTPRPSQLQSTNRSSSSAGAGVGNGNLGGSSGSNTISTSSGLASSRRRRSPLQDSVDTEETRKVTPAASAILRALDDAPSRRVLSVRDPKPTTSTPSRPLDSRPLDSRPLDSVETRSWGSSAGDGSVLGKANDSFRGDDSLQVNKTRTETYTRTENIPSSSIEPQQQPSAQQQPLVQQRSEPQPSQQQEKPASGTGKFSSLFFNSNSDSDYPSFDRPTSERREAATLTTAPSKEPVISFSAHELKSTPAASDDASNFEFDIPRSKISREMTPAEEEVVARSQAEFQF